MSTFPKRSLGPAAEPWGRAVEAEISRIDRVTSQNDVSVGTAQQMLSTQLSSLATKQNAILAQQAELMAQQATLTSQQESLLAQQAALQTVVKSIPVTLSGEVRTTGWQATNNANLAILSIPWPEGKTRASVIAQYSGFYASAFEVPNSDLAVFRIRVNGVDGPFQPMVRDNQDTYWLIGNSSRQLAYAVGVEFVTISVNTLAGPTLAPSNTENAINLSAMVVFS